MSTLSEAEMLPIDGGTSWPWLIDIGLRCIWPEYDYYTCYAPRHLIDP